jgi:hypothetical protein
VVGAWLSLYTRNECSKERMLEGVRVRWEERSVESNFNARMEAPNSANHANCIRSIGNGRYKFQDASFRDRLLLIDLL